MMAQAASNAILAKAHAMYGKRLRPENYRDLLNRHSVSEVAAYLKSETVYAKTLAGIQENLIHRGQLENLIRRDTLMKFVRLAQYETERGKGFYHYYIVNLESEQILACLRLMNSGQIESYIETLPGYLMQYLSFDVIKLAHARSFDDVLDTLAKTEYYDVLLPCRPAPGARPDLFRCEFALRQHFYDRTFALIDKKYFGKQRAQLRSIFTMQIELGNIASVYRLKRFFHSEPELIEQRILKTHDPAIDRRMQKLVEMRSVEEMLAFLNRTRRHSFYDAVGFSFIEHANQRMRYAHNRRLLAYSPYPSVVFASYLVLSQIEIDNIVSIIEGIRYKIPESDIAPLLVM